MTNWLYEGKPYEPGELNPKEIYGFVYEIENLTNNKKYIGKKLFWFSKTRQVNKKKKKFLVESDWKDYYGSNEALKADVKDLGPENFRRTILKLCRNKSECSYWEIYYQLYFHVIISDNYYNDWVMCRVRRSQLRLLIEETKNDDSIRL